MRTKYNNTENNQKKNKKTKKNKTKTKKNNKKTIDVLSEEPCPLRRGGAVTIRAK
jgi:hypothetical protein